MNYLPAIEALNSNLVTSRHLNDFMQTLALINKHQEELKWITEFKCLKDNEKVDVFAINRSSWDERKACDTIQHNFGSSGQC